MEDEGQKRAEGTVYVVTVPDNAARTSSPDVIDIALRGWKTIAATTLMFGVLALVIGFAMPTIYRAQTTLAPVSAEQSGGLMSNLQGQLGGLAALAGVNIGKGDTTKQEAIARLNSRDFTYRFLKDEGLMPVLFSDRWDAENNRWRTADLADQPTLEDGYVLFNDDVRTVTEDRVNGLVRLSVDWRDPELAKTWTNRMVERINSDMRNAEIEEAKRSIQYLHQELEKTNIIELRQAIYRLTESQVQKIMVANVREQYAFKVIDPAHLPGRDSIVRPRRVLLLALGLMAGFLIGLFIALLRPSGAES